VACQELRLGSGSTPCDLCAPRGRVNDPAGARFGRLLPAIEAGRLPRGHRRQRGALRARRPAAVAACGGYRMANALAGPGRVSTWPRPGGALTGRLWSPSAPRATTSATACPWQPATPHVPGARGLPSFGAPAPNKTGRPDSLPPGRGRGASGPGPNGTPQQRHKQRRPKMATNVNRTELTGKLL